VLSLGSATQQSACNNVALGQPLHSTPAQDKAVHY